MYAILSIALTRQDVVFSYAAPRQVPGIGMGNLSPLTSSLFIFLSVLILFFASFHDILIDNGYFKPNGLNCQEIYPMRFPIFYNSLYYCAKRPCCLWRHRHLAQKVSGKLAFQSAFMCKVLPSLCDGNLLALQIAKWGNSKFIHVYIT